MKAILINTKKWKRISGKVFSVCKNKNSETGEICQTGGRFWFPYKKTKSGEFFQPLNPFI